jgi:hypothetical protein
MNIVDAAKALIANYEMRHKFDLDPWIEALRQSLQGISTENTRQGITPNIRTPTMNDEVYRDDAA